MSSYLWTGRLGAARRMQATSPWLPALLGFLTAIGSLSTDMYLPAFPAIEATYHVPPGSAQITLATWFAGLAVGQITQGTLADRYGRRGPLIFGLILFTGANIGCATAPSLWFLAVMRFIAAFGGSASTVLPRAVVRDLADGHAAARLMSQLMLVMGVAPILGPTLGGAMLSFASWHIIFWFGVAYGAISLFLVWKTLPETLEPARRVRVGLAGIVVRYITVLRERSFLVHASIAGLGMFGLFAYLAGSPPVYIGLFHVSPPVFGVLFGLCAAGYILASQVNPMLLRRFGPALVLRVTVRCYLVATVVMAVLAFIGGFGLMSVFLPIWVSMFCLGCVQPTSAIGALSSHAAHAGSASALLGTMQFVLAAISGTVVGLLTDGTARPMAGLMVFGAACAMVADLYRAKK